MKKFLLLFYLLGIAFIGLSRTVFAMPVTIDADAEDKSPLLNSPSVERYEDKNDRLTIKDILEEKESAFLPVLTSDKNNDLHTLWFRFTLKTNQPFVEKWLELLPAYLDQIDIYLVRNGEVYQHDKSGISVPHQQKLFNYNHPLFKILLSKEKDTTVYLRIKPGIVSVHNMVLWTPSHFLKNEMVFLTIKAAVLGMYVFMIIASLWFELVIKNGVYRSFALYVGSCLILNLMTLGWWYEVFNTASISLILIALMWTVPCGIVFFLRFTKAEVMRPRLTKYMIRSLFTYGFLMTVLFGVLSNHTKLLSNIDNVMTLLIIAFSLYLVWKPVLKGEAEVRYVFMSLILILGISVVLVTLELLGMINHSDIIKQLPFATSTIFFVMVFYFLAKQYKNLREERDNAILDLLTMSQNAEQELTRQVQEKTKSIVNANIEIEKVLKRERQAYQDKNNFIAMVSHEFKTPLAVIAAAVQNLLRVLQSDVATQKLKKIQMSVNRLNALMNEHLSQDRLSLLHQSIQEQWVDIHTLITDAVGVGQSLSPDHPITYQSSIDDQYLWADPDLFKLVIHTLIENAVKYTPEGTHIQIRLSKTDSQWQVDVIDDGPGIPAIEEEKIFDKNYRASSSSNHSGTGMGLSLARYLMQMQNGDLVLYDNTDNGCWFRMIFKMTKQTTEMV